MELHVNSHLQVITLRRMCALPQDLAILQCDAWGVKKLFSYGCRRAGFDKSLSKSPQRRAPRSPKIGIQYIVQYYPNMIFIFFQMSVLACWQKVFLFLFRSYTFFLHIEVYDHVAQESGVNDFYEEVFKWWSIKSRGSSVSLGDDVVEIADSGDEGGDLSVILDVRAKDEVIEADPASPVPLKVIDDPYTDAAEICDELRDYTVSALDALSSAMAMEASAAYPDLDDDDVDGATPKLAEAEEHDVSGDGYDKVEVQAPASEVPSEKNLPENPPTLVKPDIVPGTSVDTVSDIEEKIRQLKYFGSFCLWYFIFWIPFQSVCIKCSLLHVKIQF